MNVGVTIPTYDLQTGSPLALRDVADYARRAEAAGFDSAWVMDHHWLERDGDRIGAHEPNVTLAYVAGLTSKITLGTLVLGDTFRSLNQLAREAAALADALPNRFILGLGCGSQAAEHAAFELPFRRRVSRLESTLRVLPALLDGERLTYRDDFVQLTGASILVTRAAPPIWIAGFGPRMLGLAAKYAAGWNTAWHGPDATVFRAQLRALHEQLAAAERPPAAVEVSVGFSVLPVEGAERDRLVDRIDRLRPRDESYSWPSPVREQMLTGSAEQIAASVLAYTSAGATYAIFNLSPSPFSLLDASLLDRAAATLRYLK